MYIFAFIDSYPAVCWLCFYHALTKPGCNLFESFRCRKLPKGLKDYAAFDELKRKLDEFSELVPLLEQMANKAMQRRHWDRISQLVGRELDYESDQFSMKSILECDLYKHREDIEVRFSCFSEQIILYLYSIPTTNSIVRKNFGIYSTHCHRSKNTWNISIHVTSFRLKTS